jgi:hypothetical protein
MEEGTESNLHCGRTSGCSTPARLVGASHCRFVFLSDGCIVVTESDVVVFILSPFSTSTKLGEALKREFTHCLIPFHIFISRW